MPLTNYTRSSIGEFDANLDSFIQLNSSKVPAQDNVYSVVIGTGGTGLDALLEAKGLINKTCCQDDDHKSLPTTHVAYLVFDTDSQSLQHVSSKQTGGAMLDDSAGEFVQMKAPNLGVFLSQAFRSQVPSYISSWLDFSISPKHTGIDGAGGIRQCGRLLLFQNIERIRTAIHSAIRTITADKTVDALNIYLLSGISGGTGSGTFLDLAYIAQNVAETIAPSKVTMYGYLFLPDVNLSRPMPEDNAKYSRKNGYAALKELDYLMNMHSDGGRFIQRYSPNYIIDTEKPPFHYVHLISSTGEDGRVLKDPYRQGMRAVAQSIVSFVAREQQEGVSTEFAMKSHYSNISHATEQHNRKFPERRNSYLALGTYSYELPIDQILLYVTSLLFEKMNGMFDRNPAQPEIDNAYAALHLSPRGLLSELAGTHAAIAPTGVTWEDLFGKNPKYNLSILCKNWINRTTIDIQNRAHSFVAEFPAQFKTLSEGWFTNPERGPIWVNHLIVLNDSSHQGLDTKLRNDFNIAGSQITATKTKIEKANQELQGVLQEAQNAGALFGKRAEKTKMYVELINHYADLHAQAVALVEMQKIYKKCLDVILEENQKFFDVIVDVLEGLKDVCEKNADILTRTEKNMAGDHFTWQPLRIPDVSEAIRQAFDTKGDAAQTIANFSQAVYQKAYTWSNGNVDVKAFIKDYLDSNLGDIANRSLEDYIKAVLKGRDLRASVITSLGPTATQTSVPLFALSQSADKGGKFWLLSVPYRCQEILEAFHIYRASTPDMAATLTIQPSGINSRIFAQSILSALPLWSYTPLAEYEQAYLDPSGNSGKHLYMGKEANWEELPTPIPYRSRPKMEGAYPPAIQQIEDKQRELFRRCREMPIIRKEDGHAQTIYALYIAQLPDLSAFAESKMKDDTGRMDAKKLKEALNTLDNWLTHGLPNRALSDSVHNVSYPVAVCAIPEAGEPDQREEDACESFLGEYNNIRRAKVELEKYREVQETRDELQKQYTQIQKLTNNARQVIYLLISGVVKLKHAEDGSVLYQYVLNENPRSLVKLNARMSWREFVLNEAMENLAADEQPMRRDLAKRISLEAQKLYQQMNAAPETLDKKLESLGKLLAGVQKRHDQMICDMTDGIADENITMETVSFYEKLISSIRREQRDVEERKGAGDDNELEEF